MNKKCDKCGKVFDAFQPTHKFCPECKRNMGNPGSSGGGGGYQAKPQYQQHGGYQGGYQGGQQGALSLPDEMKLDDFYNPNGSLRKEVYTSASEGIATLFDTQQVTPASTRRFFEAVRSAHDQFIQDKPQMGEKDAFDRAMEKIYRLKPLAQKCETREVTKRCFTDFMFHYIDLTSKDPKNIKGFKELFMSVIGYMKKK